MVTGNPQIRGSVYSFGYAGAYLYQNSTAFTIQKVNVGHAASYFTNPNATSTGVYWIAGMANCTPATNSEAFKFKYVINTTEQNNTASQLKLGVNGDYGIAVTIGFIDYTAGQKIWAVCINLSGAHNITIRNGNMTLRQVA